MQGLSLALPCYNEAKNLPEMIEGYANQLKQRGIPAGLFKLILVDNGSTDDTRQVLGHYLRNPEYEFLSSVTVNENKGYGHGILQGLLAAKSNLIGFSHADGQCPADDVFTAWEIADKNPETIVKGCRIGRATSERLFSRGFDLTTLLLLRRWLHEINAQPKIFPSSLLPSICSGTPQGFAFDLHVLLRAKEMGLSTMEFKVSFHPRAHGVSNWSHSFRSRIRTTAGLVRFMRAYRKLS